MKKVLVAFLIVAALIGGCFLRFPKDPLTMCQKQLDGAIEQWRISSDGTKVYPNIDGDARKSFAPIAAYIKNGDRVLDSYGFVPGLHLGDPEDLVMMYLKKKTRRYWNGDHSGSIFRKPKWMVIDPNFTFFMLNHDVEPGEPYCAEGGLLEDTETFKARLQKTLDFLKENNRPNWENIAREHTEFLDSIKE